jgi:hypothetical protein
VQKKKQPKPLPLKKLQTHLPKKHLQLKKPPLKSKHPLIVAPNHFGATPSFPD